MRLIDADYFKEQIAAVSLKGNVDPDKGLALIELVDAVPTAYELDEVVGRLERHCNGRWISCEDRLPDDGVDVLVWYEYFRYGDYNRLFQTTGISYAYDGEWSGFVNEQSGWSQLSIIAWQPLPQPYKGE